MKRMNEYFETPITGIAFRGLCQAHLFDAEVDDMVANAINNVDALADALEFLLTLPRGASGRIIIEKSEETLALAALASYRGTK